MNSLALFPLSAPLFPQQSLDLQIFEQRYLALISRCLKSEQGFGIVQIREGREVGAAPQIFQFGVEASIVDWRQQANGLLGITVVGKRKFTVRSTSVQADQLLLADVDWLEDEPRLPIPEYFDGLQILHQQLCEHPMVARMGLAEPQYSCELGWHLCQLLPLSVPDKVALLSMNDPEARLEQLAERVRRLGEE